MKPSPLKPRLAAPKEAGRALITACGGLDPAAAFAELSRSVLFRQTDDSEENAGRYLNIETVRRLERACGQPIVTAMLAAETGHALVPLYPAESVGLAEGFARFARENAQAFAALAEGLADGRMSPAEAATAKRELDECLREAAALSRRLGAIVEPKQGEG